MKNIFKAVLLLFLLSSAPGLWAGNEKATMTFFIGDVTVITAGKGTVPARLDMTLGGTDMIKTGRNSQAEIRIGSAVYYVGENKSIKVASLPAGGNPPALLNAMKRIRTTSHRSITTTAGVRGDRADEDNGISWAGDDSQASGRRADATAKDDEVLNRMAAQMSQEKYTDAWSTYTSANVSPGKKENLDFMGAMAAYNLCRYADAGRIFGTLSAKAGDAGIKAESTFYSGVCFHSLGRYNDSITCFTRYLSDQPAGGFACQARFLRGAAYMANGQKDKGREDLKQVTSLYPADPLARDAEAMLRDDR